MNIRIARYPAGTSHIDPNIRLQDHLDSLFNDYAIDVVEDSSNRHVLRIVFYPGKETAVKDILTEWMTQLTTNYGRKDEVYKAFREAGNEVPLGQITSLSITVDDMLYEDLTPVTNIPENNTIRFIFNKKIKNNCDQQYMDLLRHTRDTGTFKSDRTGTGTTSIFGHQMRFDLSKGIPLLTTKKVHLKSVIHELIWFLNGDTNIKYLTDNGVTIWNEWADANGELGPVYGRQWRNWTDTKVLHPVNDAEQIQTLQEKERYIHMGDTDYRGVAGKMAVLVKEYDQIAEALELLQNNPDSRRIVVSAWNVGELSQMKLMPCHSLFQFYTTELTNYERHAIWERTYNTPPKIHWAFPLDHETLDHHNIPRHRLSCQLYQRSCDIFLGLPFNIASYAILTHMFAQQLNMVVGDFVWTGGDTHIYKNHAEQVEKQLSRTWRELPTLSFARKPESIFDYKIDDFVVTGYDPHPGIKAPVAV